MCLQLVNILLRHNNMVIIKSWNIAYQLQFQLFVKTNTKNIKNTFFCFSVNLDRTWHIVEHYGNNYLIPIKFCFYTVIVHITNVNEG